MDRKEFIKLSALFGISLQVQNSFANISLDKPKSITILGAGAAGMAAGYFLKQYGIDFQILEASNSHGGRIKRVNDFADFPVPLGAEWIHDKPNILDKIVDDSNVKVTIQTKAYEKDTVYAEWINKKLFERQAHDPDLKFVNSSWFDFFEEYIYPHVKKHIKYSHPVGYIDYTNEQIKVILSDEFGDIVGAPIITDKVIVTAPVKMLKQKMHRKIRFKPELPIKKREAIEKVKVWDGFKAFFQFKEKFYHTGLEFPIKPKSNGQKFYYDAAYGQDSDQNILGLFTVGNPAKELSNVDEEQAIKMIIAELDEVYKGAASKNYIKHLTQDWQKEPFIKGAYTYDHENWKLVRELGKSVDDKIYFAGSAYTDGENWSNVHTAALSAKRVVEEILS